MSITVYSKPACTQCSATYRALERVGLDKDAGDYEVIDITKTEGALEKLKSLGFSSAPVVVTDTEAGSWAGFRMDKIVALKAALGK